MNHPITCGTPDTKQWKRVLYDVKSIDEDIERLIGLFRDEHGYSHEKANSELVRRLSFATI